MSCVSASHLNPSVHLLFCLPVLKCIGASCDILCMRTKCLLCIVLLALLLSSSTLSGNVDDLKRSSSKKMTDTLLLPQVLYPIGQDPVGTKREFSSEVQCTVRMVGSSYWAIDGWLVGDELYKVYQDVDLLPNDCSYPFYVTEVAIEFQCAYAGTVYVQVDIEDIDSLTSTEGCPYPGPLLGISEEFGFIMPGGGYFLLITMFDEPVLVTGPYFAGIYFGSGVDQLLPALITDDDPYLCVSWNDWGEGFVDLISNPYFNFPGNLVAYSSGYNAPEDAGLHGVSVYSPADSTTQSGYVTLCAAEMSDTVLYEKCVFEYYSPTGWTLIQQDFSSAVTLRNGMSPAVVNPGYTCGWDVSSLPENWYAVRAMLFMSGNVVAADTIELYIDNTPLRPRLLKPLDGESVCDTSTLQAAIEDEDVTFVQFELRKSNDTIDLALPLLNQYRYGDVDGDTLDMNPYTQGEFGDFYNGPTLIVSALKYFADRGYPNLMMSGTTPMSVRGMIEMVADSSRVRQRLGSQDDNLLGFLVDHVRTQGRQFHIAISDEIDLNELLFYVACRGGVLLLGIGQPFGHWLAIKELYLSPGLEGNLACSIYDTRGGSELSSELRLLPNAGIEYQGSFRDVDRVVAVYPRADTTAREVLGGDFNSSDGWSFFWGNAASKPEGSYILSALGIDIAGHVGEGTSWIERTCEEPYMLGDANGTGVIDIDDVVYLLEYMFMDGPAPVPDTVVGDVNLSGYIDIDDVVYLLEYMFMGGPPPGQ